MLAANAVFHLRGYMATRRYSPGMITALGLYVPLATYGFMTTLQSGTASLATAAIAIALGVSYQFWSDANHRRRARRRA